MVLIDGLLADLNSDELLFFGDELILLSEQFILILIGTPVTFLQFDIQLLNHLLSLLQLTHVFVISF